MEDIYADFPEFTPGRIHYGTLRAILQWKEAIQKEKPLHNITHNKPNSSD